MSPQGCSVVPKMPILMKTVMSALLQIKELTALLWFVLRPVWDSLETPSLRTTVRLHCDSDGGTRWCRLHLPGHPDTAPHHTMTQGLIYSGPVLMCGVWYSLRYGNTVTGVSCEVTLPVYLDL